MGTQGFVGLFQDWNSTFLLNLAGRLAALLRTDEARRLPEVSENERWASPVARPGKIVCVGLNFSDHANESGMAVPTEPVLFLKATNTVVGPLTTFLSQEIAIKPIGRLNSV